MAYNLMNGGTVLVVIAGMGGGGGLVCRQEAKRRWG